MIHDNNGDEESDMVDMLNCDVNELCVELKRKIEKYENIIIKTHISANNYRFRKILSLSEYNLCIHELDNLLKDIQLTRVYLNTDMTNDEIYEIMNDIQTYNNRLSCIIKTYGTNELEDLIYICYGSTYLEELFMNKDQFIIDLFKYINPIKYKLVTVKEVNKPLKKSKNSILNDINICIESENVSFHEIEKTNDENDRVIYLTGLKVLFKNNNNSILVTAIVDNISIEFLKKNIFILEKMNNLYNYVNIDEDSNFFTYIKTLTLKDYLLHSFDSLIDRYNGFITNVNTIKSKHLPRVVTEFINSDFYTKRIILIQLLITDDIDNYYLAYLLFDTISSDDKNNIDTILQSELYESLPLIIKNKFKLAMKQTMEYTEKLSNYDVNNKLPLEQRICLMNTNDKIKEKAMIKLKEVQAKSDDNGTKARQYLDGILKIPFGVYKQEPIFNNMKDNKNIYNELVKKNNIIDKYNIEHNDNISNHSIIQNCNKIINIECMDSNTQIIQSILIKLEKLRKNDIHEILVVIQNIYHKNNIFSEDLSIEYLLTSYSLVKSEIITEIKKILEVTNINNAVILEILLHLNQISKEDYNIRNQIFKIKNNTNNVNKYIKNVRNILDKSVYGHDKAKKQMERIIGQWMHGNDSGYCLGFEGPPGVGKTSLAKKGLVNCLIDDNGVSRPFAFIAIGGSSNGSTLEGHNYTYVGSTWGRIVDILMENKCMNPIIFIDEIDKVSRTESGKEIISILTHLIDPTQNDTFQDKYFSGIDFDLSKVLFIFSYNDVELLDRILLDRIHRIKFDHLTLDEKKIIYNKHLLPEIYEKMGQSDIVYISDDIVEFIIESYTCESGVRKFKELLYEIIGEVNLELIRGIHDTKSLPIEITEHDIKTKYLKERHVMIPKIIHKNDMIGIINGLWANSLGHGGVIPIESSWIPSSNLIELKLTGQQGDVMKESMSVAKTLAWSLLTYEEKNELTKESEKNKSKGIHIHCPEGATPKDGPSAGTAITTALYSLMSGRKIRYDLAITGEISLQGFVTAIGGLELKILGGIKAGVKIFLFPEQNKRDFEKFMEKYENNDIIKGIEFHTIETIQEALMYSIVD